MDNWINCVISDKTFNKNCFTYDLKNLESNSVYEYRSFVVINGVMYYGDIKRTYTLNIPTYAPSLITGNANCITNSSIRICNNVITDNGNLNISEYGVLYTQISELGTSEYLRLENYPSLICKKSICSSIPVNNDFFIDSICEINNLSPNTVLYYRSFAVNSKGIGYGEVKSDITNNTGITPISVYLYKLNSNSLNETYGYICTSPLIPNNESLNINVEIVHSIINSGNINTVIFCKNNNSDFVEIYNCNTNYSICDNLNIEIKNNDIIKWYHCIDSNNNSFGNFKLNKIDSYTNNIYPIISKSLYENFIYG